MEIHDHIVSKKLLSGIYVRGEVFLNRDIEPCGQMCSNIQYTWGTEMQINKSLMILYCSVHYLH